MFCSKCGAAVADGTAFCPACGAPSAGSTGGAVALQQVYAGFWLRLVAHILDHLIVGIPLALVILVTVLTVGAGAFFGGLQHPDRPEILVFLFGGAFLSILCLAIAASWLYYAFCESSSWQGTLGKKALSLAVTDLSGARVTFGRASGRYFAKIVSALIPLWIGYIMAGFTEKKQALHDMIAGCLVIRRV